MAGMNLGRRKTLTMSGLWPACYELGLEGGVGLSLTENFWEQTD